MSKHEHDHDHDQALDAYVKAAIVQGDVVPVLDTDLAHLILFANIGTWAVHDATNPKETPRLEESMQRAAGFLAKKYPEAARVCQPMHILSAIAYATNGILAARFSSYGPDTPKT